MANLTKERSKTKAPTTRPATVTSSAPRTTTSNTKTVSPEDRYRMIAEAAYFRAQARNFEPGHEEADWLAAEKEVTARLKSTGLH